MKLRPFWINRLQAAWRQAPIVWLAGVRRVGKTTLAKALPADEVAWLDGDSQRAKQEVTDPEFFLANLRRPILVLDEMHQLPDPTRLLKIAADQFPALRVLATGSSTLAASRKFRDALTGRKRVVVLPPVLCAELEAFEAGLDRRLLHGGLPPRLLSPDPDPDFYAEWLDSYFARDVQELFTVGKRHAYLKLLEVLFRQSGGLLDISRLARDTELTRPTVMSYLDIAEATLTVRLVRPFHGGSVREFTHQPKAYAFDTGFVCYARGWDHLREDDRGTLWEHLVLDTLLAVCPVNQVHFWRDGRHREVDFVVPRTRDRVDAFECKWQALSPGLAGLQTFRRAYPDGDNYVVTPQADGSRKVSEDGFVYTVIHPRDVMKLFAAAP